MFSVHASQSYSKTGITSDLKIQTFVRLHRYRECQILVLSESIKPWDRTIHRKTSLHDSPLLWTTLPRYVKLPKISMSSPHT